MKSLRRTIRKLILESYELTHADVEDVQFHGRRNFSTFDKDWPEARIRKHWDNRGEGIQGTEPTKRDIDVMKAFNQSMNSSPKGKQIIKDFQSGSIQILHSIEYQGLLSRKKKYQTSDKPFTKWLQDFGRKGNDMISVLIRIIHDCFDFPIINDAFTYSLVLQYILFFQNQIVHI